MAGLRTEYPFLLPKGVIDADGQLHREGTMRLATARDELEPLSDPKVRDADDPYLTIVVLSRVITKLGNATRLTPRDVEGMFAADLAYLQDVYGAINYGTPEEIDRLTAIQGRETGPAPLAAQPTAQAVADAPAQHAPPIEVPEPAPVAGRGRGRRARIEEVGRSSGHPGTVG